MSAWLHRIFRNSIFVLFTIPTLIVIGLAVLPFPFLWLDSNYAKGALSPFVLQLSPDSAVTFLSVVATGAITALSLTYSLVLLVFTLAAGNIGPRLLRRFTGEPVNQITAGIFGGTFLYCLVTLLMVREDYLPKLTISAAGLLAVISVLQLINFVRHVSRSITIDVEIAAIAARLVRDIDDLLTRYVTLDEPQDKPDFTASIAAKTSGYIGEIQEKEIADLAAEADMTISLAKPAGEFVLKDEPLVLVTRSTDEALAGEILSRISLENSRSDARNIEFSINLLVEIALRALSPGVNDTFTAIACLDAISNALSTPVKEGLPRHMLFDENDNLRLVVPGLSLHSLIGTAFHPMRRACLDNILMARALAKALARLASVAQSDNAADILEEHARLLTRDLKKAGHQTEDLEAVTKYLPGAK